MRDQVKKIAGSIVDVAKDCNNSYVYLGNAFKSIKAWELGMLYFVGIYTVIGMILPALAYAIIFDCLISDKKETSLLGIRKLKLKHIYMCLSILFSPFVAIIRYVYNLSK